MDRKLKKNLSYQTIYQVLTVLTPLIVTPYVSRRLGSHNLGIYSYSYSIAYYFLMFAMLGVANYGNRTIATVNDSKEERSRVFWEIYSFQLLMAVVMVGLYAIYLLTLCEYEPLISSMQILYVMTAFVDISWLFFGIEDVKPVVIRNTIVKLVSLIGVFTLVKNAEDLWIYTLLLTGGQFLGSCSMWLSIKGKIDFVKPSITAIAKHIIPNLTLFIPVIAVSVYKTMDKIMLGSLTTDSQVGFYTNAESLINAPMGFIIAVGIVMLPRITNLLSKGEIEKSIEYFRTSLKLTMCFSCAVAFGIIAVAPTFVPIYYGDGFEECVFLLQGQSVVMLFLAWANVVRTQFLLPHKHDKQYILSIVSGAGINFILNWILIPKYQAAGALIATLFAEGMVCLIQSLDAARHINMLKCLLQNVYFLVAGIVMFLIIKMMSSHLSFSSSLVSLLSQVFCGVIIYIVMIAIYYLFLTKVLKKRISIG
ncbi:flippase [Enterococcus cecorum]|uniref:Uncharacterized protein n=1 Tax=Enterococcus cecorum TaxID=44008 RepID=A0A200HRE4_9ENTE|nr:flippase [Enterococcus cecorum]OUZ14859.1 hypothetical protein A5869_001964 [Enterococcus cecorum]